jgi:uncharacterized FAD-dependent dehydrogenase
MKEARRGIDYRIDGLRLPLGGDEAQLGAMAADALGLDESEIVQWRILRRAIDARRHRPPAFVYVVALQSVRPVPLRLEEWKKAGMTVREASASDEAPAVLNPPVFGKRPVVVGGGPAGLFAALTLARHGVPPLLLERGKAVEERSADVDAFWTQGIFDPESSVQFGEGGAGTFSDGKLTSRVKNPLSGWVKGVLVEMGASPAILTDAKPHIGTDRLREVLVNLRRHLIRLGCEVRFRARMTDLLTAHGRIAGLVVDGGEEIRTDCLILACGQSADDTYLLLSTCGVRLEPKPFALGLRIEHPQGLIDAIQYGKWAGHPQLPPAEYVLTAHVEPEDRSVYTFCMCPGGRVIGASARGGDVITNGMSGSRRDGPYANSAVVVNCRVEDFLDQSGSPLSGIRFRRHWEKRAFVLGGGDYRAPAEGLLSFWGTNPALWSALRPSSPGCGRFP